MQTAYNTMGFVYGELSYVVDLNIRLLFTLILFAPMTLFSVFEMIIIQSVCQHSIFQQYPDYVLPFTESNSAANLLTIA